MRHLSEWFSTLSRLSSGITSPILPQWASTTSGRSGPPQAPKIEGFPEGYPQYSALIASHEDFFIFRNFRRTRARILLAKQDRLSLLEKQLDHIDEHESLPLFLGKIRGDQNIARTNLLAEIGSCMDDYDSSLQKTRNALNASRASHRDVLSLKNWLDANACISGPEVQYLQHQDDLFSLGLSGDGATRAIEVWLEDKLIQYYPKFRKLPGHNVSDDPHVYIYSGSLLHTLTSAVILSIVSSLLLIPVIICSVLESVSLKIIIIVIAMNVYLFVLTWLTRLKTPELILAGATFAAVLIVFITNSPYNG